MNGKQQKTLDRIAAYPDKGELDWADIESLFMALGSEREEGAGSRVVFVLNGKRARFHRPHPQKEARDYQVRSARDFFKSIGVIS